LRFAYSSANVETTTASSDWVVKFVMTPIQEIRPENIRRVIYRDTGTPGRINTVEFIMEDGHSHVFSGDDLALALAVAKEKFPAEPGSKRIADQPVKK